MSMKARVRSPPSGGLRIPEPLLGGDGSLDIAIIRDVKDQTLPVDVPSGAPRASESDARLEEAGHALGELREAEPVEALGTVERLADLLEELLEGGRGGQAESATARP